MRSRRREEGQTAVEWLGVLLVAAIVVMGLVRAAPGMGGQVSSGICRTIAVVAGSGSCGEDGGGAAQVPLSPGQDPDGPLRYARFLVAPADTVPDQPPVAAAEDEPVATTPLGDTGAAFAAFAPDAQGRTVHARGTITRAGVARRRKDPGEGEPTLTMEGASKRCNTDRGHMIARILGGPGADPANFAVIPGPFNRGTMARFEKTIARAADQGYVLTEDTYATYEGDNVVPTRIRIVVKTVKAPPGLPPFEETFDEPIPPRIGAKPAGCPW